VATCELSAAGYLLTNLATLRNGGFTTDNGYHR
jgi:hypothetical protein